jgi:hypothetical protein
VPPLLAASLEDIRRYARGALHAADALELTPTPLAAVEAAVGLLPAEQLFSTGADVPPGIAAIAAKLMKKVMGGLAYREKRVYLNTAELALPRRRFVHGHELGHQVLPWQEQAYYADDENTLSPETRDAMEWEANAFSAELLFGLDRFTTMADSYAPGLAVPLHLSGEFQTSAHAAIRRYVATSHHRVALLTLGRFTRQISRGPYLPLMAEQCAESPGFAERFGSITDLAALPLVLAEHPAIAAAGRVAPTSLLEDNDDLVIETKRGMTTFQTQAFHNGRLNFVLLYQKGRFSGQRLRAA